MLEDAQLSWQLGDQVLAKKLLLNTINIKDVDSSLTRATALRIFGIIMADSGTEAVSTVIDQFFQPSLRMLKNIEKVQSSLLPRIKMSATALTAYLAENRIRAYEAVATYADREYNRLVGYMKSDTYLAKRTRVENNVKTIAELKTAAERSQKIDLKRSYVALTKTTDIDRAELQSTQTEYDKYLALALHNFVKVAALQSDAAGRHSVVFRIISVWFSNKRNAAVTEHLRAHLSIVPSYKFVGVIPQVAARIGSDAVEFNRLIEQLMGQFFDVIYFCFPFLIIFFF